MCKDQRENLLIIDNRYYRV